MISIVWKAIHSDEWAAADNTGRIVGKIQASQDGPTFLVTEPECAKAEYLTLGQAKAAVERLAETVKP